MEDRVKKVLQMQPEFKEDIIEWVRSKLRRKNAENILDLLKYILRLRKPNEFQAM